MLAAEEPGCICTGWSGLCPQNLQEDLVLWGLGLGTTPSPNLQCGTPGHQPCCLKREQNSPPLFGNWVGGRSHEDSRQEQPPGLLESVQKQVDEGGKLELSGLSQDRMFPFYISPSLRAAPSFEWKRLKLWWEAHLLWSLEWPRAAQAWEEEAQGSQAFWEERRGNPGKP